MSTARAWRASPARPRIAPPLPPAHAVRPQLCDRRSSSPPPTSIARRYFSLASAPRLAAPAPRSRPPIALADYIFSAICSAKLLGQDHHRLTSSLPRSPGTIAPPPAAACIPPWPPSTSVIAPSPGPCRPTPATTPAPVPIPVRRPPSPHTAGGTHRPRPYPRGWGRGAGGLCPSCPSTSAQVKPIIKSFCSECSLTGTICPPPSSMPTSDQTPFLLLPAGNGRLLHRFSYQRHARPFQHRRLTQCRPAALRR